MKAKKSWREKLADNEGLPRVGKVMNTGEKSLADCINHATGN